MCNKNFVPLLRGAQNNVIMVTIIIRELTYNCFRIE